MKVDVSLLDDQRSHLVLNVCAHTDVGMSSSL